MASRRSRQRMDKREPWPQEKRDPKHALIYCNPSAASLADKL